MLLIRLALLLSLLASNDKSEISSNRFSLSHVQSPCQPLPNVTLELADSLTLRSLSQCFLR